MLRSMKFTGILLASSLLAAGCTRGAKISQAQLPDYQWQEKVSFPNWKNMVDDSLAYNSVYSFDFFHGQGTLYVTVGDGVKEFNLYINNEKISTKKMHSGGTYSVDISKIALDGTNTIQVTNVVPENLDRSVTVSIPYPVVVEKPSKKSTDRKIFKAIGDIIESDIRHGFTSAQIAVIKDGEMIYKNAWGKINSCNPDGSRLYGEADVNDGTMYDLASVTKMYSVVYGIQWLADKKMIRMDDTIESILGKDFTDKTAEIRYASFEDGYPGLEAIKEWKSAVTVKDVMNHTAGFAAGGHYYQSKFDAVTMFPNPDIDNPLYVKGRNRQNTLTEGIFRTPLYYKPGTRYLYSDIDYMILAFVIEKITGKNLQDFLKETYWDKIGLSRISYNPLDNGFSAQDCAATEPRGNSRDSAISFNNMRTYTLQGEVHDEEAWGSMEGISGHAGLFSNASDLAKLSFAMLTGGYGGHRFFSKDIRDYFASSQDPDNGGLGLGWRREGDKKRAWYYGTQSPESNIGHNGWTKTLTMIDFENNLIMVYLTNSKNSRVTDTSDINLVNKFDGDWYTSATMGFAAQLIYMGIYGSSNIDGALDDLVRDMAYRKMQLVMEEKDLRDDHPIHSAFDAIKEVAESRGKKLKDAGEIYR